MIQLWVRGLFSNWVSGFQVVGWVMIVWVGERLGELGLYGWVAGRLVE